MNENLPSSWMSQFLIVILLISVGVSLIPTALFSPAYLWEYLYPPGGPQPLTTPFLSMTIPLLGFGLFLLLLGYQRAKRFVEYNKEWHQR